MNTFDGALGPIMVIPRQLFFPYKRDIWLGKSNFAANHILLVFGSNIKKSYYSKQKKT